MNKEKTSITLETKNGKEYTRHRTDVLIPIVMSKPADKLSKSADLKPVIKEKPSVPADKNLTDMPAKNGNPRRSPRFPAAKTSNRKTNLLRSANDKDNNLSDLHGTIRSEAARLNNVKHRVTWGSVEVFSIYEGGDPTSTTSLVFQQKEKL